MDSRRLRKLLPTAVRGYTERVPKHFAAGFSTMINLQNLLDDVKCYETVRRLRGPEGSGARTVMRPN